MSPVSASKVAEGEEVPGVTCACSGRPHNREQWRFLGRETHWGYDFLVWTLEANPRGRRKVGQRFARWVRA